MSRKICNGLIVPNERELEMHLQYMNGQTLDSIGKTFGVTRELVRQRMKACFGETRSDTGYMLRRYVLPQYLAQRDAKYLRQRKREWKIYKVFGCHEEIVTHINGGRFSLSNNSKSNSPAHAYQQQRYSAYYRGIRWEISFPEWWEVWKDSGKWSLRGRGHGYCMARYGDSGPYAVDNVYVCTSAQNTSDQYLVRENYLITHNSIRKEYCIRGHRMSDTSRTFIYKGLVHRRCLECCRIWGKERRLRNKVTRQSTPVAASA